MPTPIRDAIEGKYKSFDALARELIGSAGELDWPPGYRSLSAKIGQLDRGNSTWWQSRPAQMAALATLLGTDPADLGVHAARGEHLFHFDDFPELPPLDLRRERFCRLHVLMRGNEYASRELDAWLDPDAQRRWAPDGVSWIHVAPGTGRSVLLAELAAGGRFATIDVLSLAHARTRLADKDALVVSVGEDGGRDDLVELAYRPDGAGTLVLAPFAAPIRDDADSLEPHSWESITAPDADRRIRALTNAAGISAHIAEFAWTLVADWRKRLLEWTEARLAASGSHTLLKAASLGAWLDVFDPRQEWVRTPADLMGLCRIAHRLPASALPRYNDTNAGRLALETIRALTPQQERLFARLAVARWESLAVSWRGALPFDTWCAWSGGPTHAPGLDRLLAIAEGTNLKTRREQALQVSALLDGAAIDALIEDGLLARDARRRFDLAPRVLADLIVRDHLMTQMSGHGAERWAMACFDAERRATVDAALDALPMSDLVGILQSLDEQPAPPMVELAASEALFCAIARRILKEERIPEALHPLARRVLSRLQLQSWGPPSPWSRKLDSTRMQFEWLTVCWAWSLLPKPVLPGLDDYNGWAFLNWAAAPVDAPLWLPIPFARMHREAWPDYSLQVLHAADMLMARRATPIEQAPPFFHGGLLASSAAGKWPAQVQWWCGVIGHEEIERRLLEKLKRHGAEAALQLWPSFIRHEAALTDRLDMLLAHRSPLRTFLLSTLDADALLDALDAPTLTHVVNTVYSMPQTVRRALLSRLPLDTFLTTGADETTFFDWCTPATVTDLVRWLDSSAMHPAAMRMWKTSPEQTVAWIDANAGLRQAEAEALIDWCPPEHDALAAASLLRNPSLLGAEERHAWVMERLAQSGANAAAIFAVLVQDPLAVRQDGVADE